MKFFNRYTILTFMAAIFMTGCTEDITDPLHPKDPEPPVKEDPSKPDNPDESTPLWITDALTESMWYSTGTLRTTSAVMQSFDINFSTNKIYYSQLNNNYRLYISWSGKNSTKHEGCMTLNYFGHGSNFTLEDTGSGYIWIGNYASKNTSGEYWGDQVVSRVPIKDGATVNPWDCTDNYYFDETNLSVAVDFENDRLTILGISTGRIRTYKLSELRALPIESVTLKPLTYGGDKAPDAETTVTHTIQARDCRKATPIGDFSIQRWNGVSWQGFDVCGDLIYQMQGNGNNNDGKTASTGWLLVYKLDGTIVLDRTPIKAIEDLTKLKQWGITDTGYMEPEGVKVRGGNLYIGFASKGSKDERRGTIFKYSLNAMK